MDDSIKKNGKLGWIMALYLTGLFIGALSTGIITPVRTIIQTSLGADDQLGIWMITIYTLCYAAIIPISGKLADRHGRKIVFIISIFLFGAGSVICGLSANLDSFAVLLVGRVVQAIGAGGIMPIATAEFGTSFPEEKRGMALGMVGGVYGIANVLGATAGSAILDIFGVDKWEWIFYINIPFCLLIIIGSFIFIPNHKSEVVYKIDKIGTLLMTVIILALLYGLKNLDFFDFFHSLTEKDVYPFLIAAIVLIPIFVIIEKRAEDPIFHIEYMNNSQIVVTLMMGLLVGCSMMGMIFIPQFAENSLKISSGDGGYFVIILGLFAGAASPISGKMIDKFGSKPILGAGFALSVIGALYLALIATAFVNIFNVVISLILIGLGMGLTMGTPLNYMMLRHTNDEDSNSALATLSLVRSIGTAIAPAIMVGFIAQAGATMQDDLMKAMPDIPNVPQMEQQIELKPIVKQLSSSDEFKEMMGDTDLDSMLDMDMDMNMSDSSNDLELPDDLLKSLQSSDVTTIVATCKEMADYMFNTTTPDVIKDIRGGINEGIDGIGKGIDGVSSGIAEMNSGVSEIDAGRAKLKKGIDGISQGIAGMQTGVDKQGKAINALQQAIKMAESGQMGAAGGSGSTGHLGGQPGQTGTSGSTGHPGQTGDSGQTGHLGQTGETGGSGQTGHLGQTGETGGSGQTGAPPMGSEQINAMKAQLTKLKSARTELNKKLAKSKQQKKSMESAYYDMGIGRSELLAAIAKASSQKDLMIEAKDLMVSMRDDIPEVFAEVETQYMKSIDKNSNKIEGVYQKTLNTGFKNMYICVTIFNVIGLLLLLIYRDDRRRTSEGEAHVTESISGKK